VDITASVSRPAVTASIACNCPGRSFSIASFSCARRRMSVAETFAAAMAPPLPGEWPAHR
jgi:hypothetical protein